MDNKKKNIISSVVLVVCVILLAVFLWVYLGSGNTVIKTYENDFKKDLVEGKVAYAYLDGYILKVYKTDSKYLEAAQKGNYRNYDYAVTVVARTTLDEDVRKAKEANPNIKINVNYSDPSAVSIWDYLFPLLSITLLIVGGVILFRSISKQNNQGMDFGKSRARATTNVKVRFSDVAGAEEEKEELAEIIDFLKMPKKFLDMGARIPKGVLLVGPPGTGKTLFAKAVAGEAGVPFFSISGSDFVEMFVGVGASRVRDLFEQAKKNAPCIIFIDEIDAVGRQRGAGLGGGHDEREQTLNQLLVEMDGFETNNGVIVMAATNRSDILDPALLRPGRFDRQIFVNIPDVRGREAILKVHSRKKPLASDVDFKTVARITSGFSGADLENLLNEASILAVRAHRTAITMADVNEGINKVLMGPQKKSRLVTEPDKRITAYHESGHAILGALLKYCDPIHEVTIIPRGQAAGYTMSRPDNDNNHVTKARLMDEITMSLGGRVAEEIIIQNISTGASGDIRQLTGIAHKMVTEWGMSEKVGPLFYGEDGEVFLGRSYQSTEKYSEELSGIIDAEVRKIVDTCHKTATKLLTENVDVLHSMAKVLFEKETIHTEEVNMLIKEKKSAEEVISYMNSEEDRLSKLHRTEVLTAATTISDAPDTTPKN
ncbi:MAG: ATP-dependent zinc metalloprotease FtsH [Clostridia bacterium]